MIHFLLKFLFFILLLRLGASLIKLFRGPGGQQKKSFSAENTKDRVKKPGYDSLTPYDIEDAEYEEIPNEER